MFRYRTTWPISTNLGTKFPWENGNQRPKSYSKWDINETAKIHQWNFKKFFFRIYSTTGSISTKLFTKQSCVKEAHVFAKKKWPFNSLKGDQDFFSLNINLRIADWIGTVSQVSDVAKETLVSQPLNAIFTCNFEWRQYPFITPEPGNSWYFGHISGIWGVGVSSHSLLHC